MDSVPRIDRTVAVVTRCIEVAEAGVQAEVAAAYPDAGEEQITTLLQGSVHRSLAIASGRGEIASAFREDLEAAGVSTFDGSASRAAHGLIAEVSWHPRSVEGITGGDFGLVLLRPRLSRDLGGLRIHAGHACGLLVQAKKKRCGLPCGGLTVRQKVVLQDKMDFASIVLYQFVDRANRRLRPFRWKSCRGFTSTAIESWLTRRRFSPSRLLTTAATLWSLYRGESGTSDPALIDRYVRPPTTPVMTIEIKWPKGGGPSSYVEISPRPENKLKVVVSLS
jgi:hypothetical protein